MKYQYKVVRQPMDEEDLNEAGQEGWKLVTAPRGADTTYYFCRPVPEDFIAGLCAKDQEKKCGGNNKSWWSRWSRFWDRVGSKNIEVTYCNEKTSTSI